MHGDKGMGIDNRVKIKVRRDDVGCRRVEEYRKKWEVGVGLGMACRKISLEKGEKPENFRKKCDVWIESTGKGRFGLYIHRCI